MATAVSESVKTYQLYINGEWRDATGSETFPSSNPSNEEVIANVPRGTREDAQAAISAARQSFERGEWAAQSFRQRSEVMLKAWKYLSEVALCEGGPRSSSKTTRPRLTNARLARSGASRLVALAGRRASADH